MASIAGWYEDPEDSTQLRYWDGATWTVHRQPRSDGGAPALAPDYAASSPATGLAATPAPATGFVAPAPVSASPASPYVPTPAPAPAPYETAARSGGKGGVVVAIVVVAIVLVGVIAGAIMVLAAGGTDGEESPVASGGAEQTADAEPSPEIDLNDRAATAPAGYTYPDGWVEQSAPEVGMTYAVPETWVSLTEGYREYYEVPAEMQPSGMWITFVSAWGSEGDETYGPDDIVIVHTQFDRTTSMNLYNIGQLRSYTTTDFSVEWDPSEEYVSEQGIPVIKTVGTPNDTSKALQVYNWSIGGGNNGVDITCWVYSLGHGCEEVDDIIDTMWIDPS